MKKRLLKVMTIGLALTAMIPLTVFANDDVDAEYDFVGNYSSAGNEVTCEGISALDAFLAGGSVEVDNTEVTGNIFAAGATVSVDNSAVGSDIFVAGENVSIDDATVTGNVFAAGNTIKYESESTAEAVMLAGSEVTFDGTACLANISGETVYFNGTVNGNAYIAAEHVVIGEDARVTGNLSVKSETIEESDYAQIEEFEWEESKKEDVEKTVGIVSIWAKALHKIATRLFWIPAMLIVCLLMCWLFGKNLDDAKERIKNKPGEMILCGTLSWALIPEVCILLGITVIGLPLAAMLCAAYVVFLCAGLTFAGASLGRLCFPKLHPVLASVIGVAILELVKIVPVIGTLVSIAADMYLLGYITSNAYRFSIKKKKDEA